MGVDERAHRREAREMILLRNVKLYPDESEELLADKAAKLLHLRKSEIKSLRRNKKSVDARKKSDIHYR